MRRLMGVFDKGDTKRFKERAYGISIEYPKGWKKKQGKQQVIALFMAPKSSNVGMFAPNVNITVENLEEREMTLQEYVESSLQEESFTGYYQLISTESTTLSGLPALRIDFTGKEGLTSIRLLQVCVLQDHHVYAVTCAAEASKFEEFEPLFQAMLDSYQLEG
ncbi:MAG: PsbP-related protein [Syntrophothermaceae bacterium]|jgi:quinol monooxygenase YgiN